MKLYFFRHAEAGQGMHNDPNDVYREITEEGVEETRTAAKALAAMKLRPTHIYSSPLTRARQTAEIVGEALGVKVEIREEVGPGFNRDAVARLIGGLGNEDEVMFFGHEPDFSATVSAIIGGGSVVVKKGGLARVDVISRTPLQGELVWLVAPKVFEAVGEG